MEINHNLRIKSSPENIYKALSSKEGISGWWSKDCEVGEEEGSKSSLRFDKQGTIVEMGFETKSLMPNQKVIWKCTENANPAWLGTEIITVISTHEGYCSVAFSHAKFDEKWAGQDPFELTKGGWEHFVKSLVSYCETGGGEPW